MITIVTMTTPEIMSYGAMTNENKRQYCAAHGYKFEIIKKKMDSRKGSCWSKFIRFEQLMHTKEPGWLVWMDADMWILNKNLRLEDYLDNDHLLFICWEEYQWNCGIMAMKICEESRQLLINWYNREKWDKHLWHEQMSLNEWSQELTPEVRDATIKPLDMNLFNSWYYTKTPTTAIVHLAGEDEGSRIGYFKQCQQGKIKYGQ